MCTYILNNWDKWRVITCDEAPLPLVGVGPAVEQLQKVVKPGNLDIVESL